MLLSLRAFLKAARSHSRSEKLAWLPKKTPHRQTGVLSFLNKGALPLTGLRYHQSGISSFPLPAALHVCRLTSSCAASEMAEQRYCVDYAKRGTAGCKKCKEKILKGMVRIGKVVPNPFTESGGDMKEWYHVKCIFEKLERARATTKKIEDITDLEGWEELQEAEKEMINQHISGEMGITEVVAVVAIIKKYLWVDLPSW